MMKEETERFFEAIIKEDRPVTDLIDADFTFLNEELARLLRDRRRDRAKSSSA